MFAVGALLMLPLLKEYWRLGFTLSGDIGRIHHMAIAGLLLVIVAFMNFVFTLVRIRPLLSRQAGLTHLQDTPERG